MSRSPLRTSWIYFAVLALATLLFFDGWTPQALAEGPFSFATNHEGDAPTQATPVQRRVRVRAWGPPIPPGPVPPFVPGPPVMVSPGGAVVPAGPAVPPGPTRVRVRVPYFSGDFYVDGGVPVVGPEVGSPDSQSSPTPPPPPEFDGSSRTTARQATPVTYSSNREYNQLVRAYNALQQQLTTLTTGENWQQFLQLPLDVEPDQAVLDRVSTQAGREQLASALRRFNRIQGDPRYDSVTGLPAFDDTHQALETLVSWLDSQPVPAEMQALPPPEEVPLPPPVDNTEPEPDLAFPQR